MSEVIVVSSGLECLDKVFVTCFLSELVGEFEEGEKGSIEVSGVGCALESRDSNRCRECVGCVVVARDQEASPDTCVSQCQFPDLVDEEVKTGVNIIIIPFRHVRWSVLDGESARVEGEEGQDLGEGIHVQKVFRMVVVPSVVEGALVKDVVLVLDFGATGEIATGAFGGLISGGLEFCSVHSCEVVVG